MKSIGSAGLMVLTALTAGAAFGQVAAPVLETKGAAPLTLAVTTPTPPKIVPTQGAWTIKRDWNRREVQRYAQWVQNIFAKKSGGTTRQRQAKFPTIVNDPEMNLLLLPGFAEDNNDPRKIPESAINTINAATACGTAPILMFVYFSAVRGLPVSFTAVEGNGNDIRYSKGNHPVKRYSPLDYSDLNQYVRNLCFSDIHYTTGNWRTAPDLEGTDTVPVNVSAESTLPGMTLLYNPDGHGLVVGRVSPSGNVNMLDAHPDNSITSGQSLASVESVIRAIPERDRNRWYSGWRMIRLAKCVTDATGKVTSIRPYTNAEMRAYGYSDEQFNDIIAMKKGLPVMVNGQPVRVSSYPEYVRMKLQTVTELDPAKLVTEWADQMHTLFNERATFVAGAWANVLANGPIKYPDNKNIYQAEDRWEEWSSPSSDCDRKGAYFLGADQIESMVRDFNPARSNLILTNMGRAIRTQRDLAQAIIEIKRREFAKRTVTFLTSKSQPVTLTLDQIEKRMFAMSFDPNHAPEIRWGAAPDSPEAAGCRKFDTPLASGGEMGTLEGYRKEQRLRYRLSRLEGNTTFNHPDNPTAPRPLLEEKLSLYVGPAVATR